jgi:hypothetical protein
MFRILSRLTLLLALAACATPQQRCAIDATKELRTLDTLIAETEANLARGYAIDRTAERRPRLTFCTGGFHSHVGMSFCTADDIVYRDRPVAIDPQAEQRKLAELRQRRSAIAAKAQRDLAMCKAAG